MSNYPDNFHPAGSDTVTVEIRSRWDNSVIYSAAVPADVPEWRRVRVAVEMAVRDRVRLDGASLDGARLDGARLDGARLIDARLDGASLDGASLDGARLIGATLDGASFIGASLIGARLDGASFIGASLIGARLDGASLIDASLDGASLDGARPDKATAAPLRRATRADGYEFLLWPTDAGWRVRAGCRFFTLPEARDHWTRTRAGTPIGDETADILDMFERAVARADAKEG